MLDIDKNSGIWNSAILLGSRSSQSGIVGLFNITAQLYVICLQKLNVNLNNTSSHTSIMCTENSPLKEYSVGIQHCPMIKVSPEPNILHVYIYMSMEIPLQCPIYWRSPW